MSTSPTSRSLQECKKRGWTAQVVERYNQYSRRKVDLFGVIDIVVITPDGILGIQATSGDHHAERLAKISVESRASLWVGSGARLAVWSWSKTGARGKRKLWTLREQLVRHSDFSPAVSAFPTGSKVAP